MHYARLCRAAENEFVGVPCGILDQVSSLFGRAWNVMSIDCQSLTVDHAPLPGVALVVCPSGVNHALVGGEYKELREHCASAAHKLGAKFLRTVERKQLQAARATLTEREFACAHHVVGEIARVVAAERALRADDLQQFGQYLFQSHESSRDFLQNSSCKSRGSIPAASARGSPEAGSAGRRLISSPIIRPSRLWRTWRRATKSRPA
jgi:galactokinase